MRGHSAGCDVWRKGAEGDEGVERDCPNHAHRSYPQVDQMGPPPPRQARSVGRHHPKTNPGLVLWSRLKMKQNAFKIARVESPPYAVEGSSTHWLLCVGRASTSLTKLVDHVGRIVAPQPCAMLLRVYSEPPDPSHVLRLETATAAIDLLERCEAVGVFHSENVIRDRQAILEQLGDPGRPDDDEACLIRAVEPRSVLYLHPGHNSIDLVCTREDADRVSAHLSQAALNNYW